MASPFSASLSREECSGSSRTSPTSLSAGSPTTEKLSSTSGRTPRILLLHTPSLSPKRIAPLLLLSCWAYMPGTTRRGRGVFPRTTLREDRAARDWRHTLSKSPPSAIKNPSTSPTSSTSHPPSPSLPSKAISSKCNSSINVSSPLLSSSKLSTISFINYVLFAQIRMSTAQSPSPSITSLPSTPLPSLPIQEAAPGLSGCGAALG